MSSTAAARRTGVGGFGGWLSMAPQTDDVHMPPQPVAIVDHVGADSTQASPSQPASPIHPAAAPTRAYHHVDHGGLQPQPPPHTPMSSTKNYPSPPPMAISSEPDLRNTHTSAITSPAVLQETAQASAPSLPAIEHVAEANKPLQSPPVISNLGRAGGGPSAIPRRILPRTKARFSVGDSSASMLASPASPAPTSPSYSHKSGDGDESPPPFDVRASFAPMRWGNASDASQAGEPDESMQARANGDARVGEDKSQAKRVTAARQQHGSVGHNDDGEDAHSDGERVEVAGRKWKGKTANAIELEMEALGDRTVMSYAPDAVYLASRLEGLRRNLEAGGQRLRRWAWEDLEEEEEEEGGKESAEEHVHANGTAVSDGSLEAKAAALDDALELAAEPVAESSRMSPVAIKSLSPTPATAAGLASPLRVSHILSPVQEVPQDPIVVQQGHIAAEASSADFKIDHTAKEAALDSRVEIRTLRRPDLEQVRELHCYHGDGDKVDTETYTTSAAFLLRLLVDEHYVCLVAVAKPLPEPPSLPTRFTPRPPPPSLDMPASKSPFLLAGRIPNNVTVTAQDAASRRKSNLVPVTAVVSASHAEGLLHEAPAPRSFGAGPDSENASSSNNDLSDEEERMRQESLFEAAKAASTYVTSLPQSIDEEDETMSDVVEQADEEDEKMSDLVVNSNARKHHTSALSETEGSAMVHSPRTQMQETFAASSPRHGASTARRTSSSTTVHRSGNVVLAGPTFDVAPPRAIRVMGAPPMSGMPTESETILGVAAARIKVVQRAADELGGGNSWSLGGPMPAASKDSSWPGMDSRGEQSVVTREAHIMTLSVLPGERGQGLGARLLDLLLEECKRRTAGPRIHLATGSMTVDEGGDAATTAPPRAHENAPMRTVLETHPSNKAAMQLYTSRNFRQIAGSKGVVRHFFRGDQRIPNSVRVKVGGSDAIRMERFDVP